MIRSEMMDRMSACEFYQWTMLANHDAKPESPKDQTPEQMLAVLDLMAARAK